MLIQVTGTTTSEAAGKGGKKYTVVDVAYQRDGKGSKKTLRSFSYPEVVKFFESLETFPVTLDVKSEKNDKGFWDWTEVQIVDGAPETGAAPSGAVGSSKKNVFEERDERIVRQSSLERAVAIACHNNPKGQVEVAAILELADSLAGWVLKRNEHGADDDIPF